MPAGMWLPLGYPEEGQTLQGLPAVDPSIARRSGGPSQAHLYSRYGAANVSEGAGVDSCSQLAQATGEKCAERPTTAHDYTLDR